MDGTAVYQTYVRDFMLAQFIDQGMPIPRWVVLALESAEVPIMDLIKEVRESFP